jgi:hypothetical protein
MPAPVAAPPDLPFAVEFGRPATKAMAPTRGPGLELQIPLLAGDAREVLFAGPGRPDPQPGLNLFHCGPLRVGCVTEAVTDERGLAAQSQALYRRVLTAAHGTHLYRIWNYVPRINGLCDGFENYRAFCQGRSLAFEATVGTGFQAVLPAASAIGTQDGHLSVVFVSGADEPRHFENPEQMPAYRYPVEHGPRAPSFSRATVVRTAGRTFAFISGTAAIKGHHTVGAGSLAAQLDCTLDNLRLISRTTGHGEDFAPGPARRRHFKVYLRHAADLVTVRTRLERNLLQPTDEVVYLQADICRAPLDLEIEATLIS